MKQHRRGSGPIWATDKQPSDMPDGFGKEIDAEVKDSNFIQGGQSLILMHKEADTILAIWSACLARAGYDTHYTNPLDIVYRIEDRKHPLRTPDRDKEFDRADVLLIANLLDEETVGDLTDQQQVQLVWYINACVEDGVVVILAAKDNDTYMDNLGEKFSDLLERSFEILDGKKKKKSKVKIKPRANKDNSGP